MGSQDSRGQEQRARALERRVKSAYRNLKKTNTELHNRIEQLSALHRIGLAMRDSTTNPQRIWEMMLAEALKLLRGDSGAIYVADPDGMLRVQAAEGIRSEAVRNTAVPIGQGVVGYVAQRGEALLVADVSKEPRYLGLIEGTQSEVAAPMVGGQSIIGVINIESRRLDAFAPSDRELLVTLAGHAARVWENAMLYQMAQKHNQQLLDSYEQLREAQRQLIKKERLAALGEMAAIVAHEIRNPMTAIRGFAQRIGRRTTDDPMSSNYTSIIISEIDRLDKVITSVLDFGKKAQLQKKSTRIENIIDDALLLMDEQVQQRALVVEKYVATDLPDALVDQQQIKQVIINLLQNAIEVTPKGDMILINAVLDNNDLVMSVIDSGTGINRDISEKIFDPFFTTKTHGTGLGLAMVQRIVEDHGGAVDVANIPGKGAAFVVRLPLNGSRAALDPNVNAGSGRLRGSAG